MRTCGSTIQQALTTESLDIVRQSIILAKRRGHAQVTPLHVAHTLLSNSTGILRAACLQSRSHPLHCRALELCFNVALNRLPASNSSSMLGPSSIHPSISNALVAAFKRAQAHQRRGGSVESQQQSVLAVNIESEQLVISILDDPSVSRVMREAGFSSIQVKSNVEQAVVSSLEMSGTSQSSRSTSPGERAAQGKPVVFELDPVRNEDVLTLHPITTIHAGSSLQLSPPSHDRSHPKCQEYNSSNQVEKGTYQKLQLLHDHEKQMSCYQGCPVNFQIEKAQSFQNNTSSDQALPAWFQRYKNEKKGFPTTQQQHVWMSEITEKPVEPNLRMLMPEPLNSASLTDSMDTESDHIPNFNQLNPENITFLCNALEKKIPRQKSIVPEIVTTIMQCRSGNMVKRKRMRKQDTWLLFQGTDIEAKEKVARELACLVSGSETDNFVSIGSSISFSCRRGKRSRGEEQSSSSSYIDRFAEAVCFNPRRVFFIEDVDQADNLTLMEFKRTSERGTIGKSDGGEEVELGDAIVILSSNHVLSDGVREDNEKSSRLSLDLNVSANDVNRSVDDDVTLLEFVDRRIVFRSQEVEKM